MNQSSAAISPLLDLPSWRRGLEEIVSGARELTAPLSRDQLAWKPNDRTWSVLECFEHLRVTGELYYPRLREAVERARARGPGRPYRPTWLGRFFLRALRGKMKVKAPRIFRPNTAAGADPGLLERYFQQQQELESLLGSAEGVDLNGGRFPSPVSRWIRFSVGDGFAIMVAHQARHLQQARRLRSSPEFPSP